MLSVAHGKTYLPNWLLNNDLKDHFFSFLLLFFFFLKSPSQKRRFACAGAARSTANQCQSVFSVPSRALRGTLGPRYFILGSVMKLPSRGSLRLCWCGEMLPGPGRKQPAAAGFLQEKGCEVWGAGCGMRDAGCRMRAPRGEGAGPSARAPEELRAKLWPRVDFAFRPGKLLFSFSP